MEALFRDRRGNIYSVSPIQQPKSDWIKLTPEEVEAHLNPPVNPAQLAEDARAKRDALLRDSDWTQVSDAPVDQQAWADYRQALRDIPDQSGFPENVEWPNKPE